MSNSTDDALQLIEDSEDLPYGELRVSMVEEAVRIADVLRDDDFSFHCRIELLRVAGFSGKPELAFASLAWCIPRFEAEPSTYYRYEHSLLWYLKNALVGGAHFPQITRATMDQLFQQMEGLYDRAGYNVRTIHYAKYVQAVAMGDRETATATYECYRSLKRDLMSHCYACELDAEAEYFELMGDHEKAIEIAEPCLLGSQTCAEVPHRTIGTVLRSLALLGRIEEADEYQKKGYRLIRDNPKFIRFVALHMAYLIHRGDLNTALTLLERHLDPTLKQFDQSGRYLFSLAASHLLELLADQSPTRKLRLPKSFAEYRETGEYDLELLRAWFDNECQTLASRFDARNGNDFYGREIPQKLRY